MNALRNLVFCLIAAGGVLSAQAQTGQSDADRRMRNREQAMEQRLKMDREGGSSVPEAAKGTWRHGHRMGHARHMHHGHMHHGRMHMRHHHLHRHPVR